MVNHKGHSNGGSKLYDAMFKKGAVYGELTLVAEERAMWHGKMRPCWRCTCSCGATVVISRADVASGKKATCGRACGARRAWRTSRANRRSEGHIADGYLRVPVWSESAGRIVYIGEHRVMMQEYLGRELLPHETVHHINGDRLDNRLENFELWSTRQPKGQRVEDKVAYAREILAQYEPELPKLRKLNDGRVRARRDRDRHRARPKAASGRPVRRVRKDASRNQNVA